HLAEIEQKDEQRAGGQLSVEHQIHSIPEHKTRSYSDDDLDHRSQLCFETARAERDLNILETLLCQSRFFIVLARERFDHTDRIQHFGDYRNNFTFFLSQGA